MGKNNKIRQLIYPHILLDKGVQWANKTFFILLLFVSSLFSLGNTMNEGSGIAPNSLRDAIKSASSYDTILLKSGVYNEHGLIIDKPLTLIGQEGTIIDAEGQGEIITVTSDSVHIINLKLANVGISHTKDQAAIHLDKVKYFSIHNVVLEAAFFGILVEKSSHGTISSNQISGIGKSEFYSGNGIHLWHSDFVEVKDNKISNMRDGIYFEFVTKSKVEGNHSENNIRYGLHFMFSDNDEYNNNTFINNGAGVAVMFSKYIEMTNNTFQDNWGASSFGLLLKEIYDANIQGNLFLRNTVAIHVDGSSRIKYEDNVFKQNGWGFRVTGGCYENNVVSNDFISNSFDISYNGRLNDNKFIGNYWSNYSGYDLNRDGVGDVPFRPVSLFSYIVNKTPESVILLRSLFVDLLNYSEKVSPVFTPDNLIDEKPNMKPLND